MGLEMMRRVMLVRFSDGDSSGVRTLNFLLKVSSYNAFRDDSTENKQSHFLEALVLYARNISTPK
jgi:hypothetical protein